MSNHLKQATSVVANKNHFDLLELIQDPDSGPKGKLWVEYAEFDPKISDNAPAMAVFQDLEMFYYDYLRIFSERPALIKYVVISGRRIKFYEGLDYLCHNCYGKGRISNKIIVEYIEKEGQPWE